MIEAAGDAETARLVMKGVAKSFVATLALAGVDLAVAPGQVLALVGENVAGKSTLMKILSVLISPMRGRCGSMAGRIAAQPQRSPPRRCGDDLPGIGPVPAPVGDTENILLGCEITTGPLVRGAAQRSAAANALARVGRPDISPDAQVSRLGIAERQLVEIARAVAVGCRVLVLDEPTSSLPKRDAQHLFELVSPAPCRGPRDHLHLSFHRRGQGHRPTALRCCATAAASAAGRTDDATEARIIALMVGRELEKLYPRSPRLAGAGGVGGDRTSIVGSPNAANASLTLRRGEVLGDRRAGRLGANRIAARHLRIWIASNRGN